MEQFIEKLIGRLSKNSIFQITTNSEGKNVFEIIEELAEEYKDKPDDEWQIIYDKVCDLEKKYAKVDGDMENVNCCIRLENLLQYFKDELRSAEEHKGGWIPCSDKYPEDNQTVLTIDSEGNMEALDYDKKWGNCFCKYDGAMKVFNIIAWQPLPEPYKAKGELG